MVWIQVVVGIVVSIIFLGGMWAEIMVDDAIRKRVQSEGGDSVPSS